MLHLVRQIMIFPVICLLMVLANLLSPSSLLMADEDDTGASQIVFKDELRRDTPYSSYLGFIAACDRRDFETAARFLDLRFLPSRKRQTEGQEIARKFKFILDRTIVMEDLSLAEQAQGMRDDGLPSTRDRIGSVVHHQGAQFVIHMDRLWENQVQVWKFSQSTLKEVPELYLNYGHGRLGEILPGFLLEYDFLSLQLWQWICLLLFLPLGYFLAKLIVLTAISLLPKLLQHYKNFQDRDFYQQLNGPMVFLLSALLYYLLLMPLNLTIIARQVLQMSLITMMFIAITWLSLRLIDLLSTQFQSRLRQRGFYAANSVIPLGRRFAKILLFILTALGLLQVYHINITALLAGLGVGGIAVALAAQKSLENLFSGIALITDQPVRVGDFCRFDNQLGNVEDIGLRSTRIRTIDRSVITIPNREFSQMKLENLSRRDRMTIRSTIMLRYETTADQLRYILMELRKLLYSHGKVIHDDRVRVRFLGFQDYAMNIDFFAHVRTEVWYEYLAIQEDIYLRVLDIINGSGTNFALPSRTVYSENGSGMKNEQLQNQENLIQQLRAEENLPFPNFTNEEISSLQNTLEYPAKGTIHRRMSSSSS
ncbi:MAG: mechanosensitive ion channel family protein [Oligoflexus sp.]